YSYFTGSRTRITEPYCTYLDIMDYSQGKRLVNFSLSAPTNKGAEVMLNTGYSVRLAQTRFRAYEMGWVDSGYIRKENILRARDYRAAICAQPEGTRLRVDTVRAFANTQFYAWTDLAAAEGALTAKITAADKVVAGALCNTTDMLFQEVYLFSQDYAVRVGDMEPGEEIRLEECRQSITWEDEEGYVGGGPYWLIDDLIEGGGMYSRVLFYIFQDYIYDNEEQTYIVALPERSECELLGDTLNNPGSNGLQIFIWGVETGEEQ
ncbi:MAG: hypothetical protein K2N63_06720, partial [Lachnospiraceae bacterium]|nr:hypothetical protein [Lachnospiraceae bacterium]